MNTYLEGYLSWLSENMDQIENLKKELRYWNAIYSKRIFDLSWAKPIQEILDLLKQEIKKQIEECQYYLKRVKEVKDEIKYTQINRTQSEKNTEDAGRERDRPEDTDSKSA